MRVGCNLLWLVPGVVGGTELATVSLLRELAAEPADGIEPVLYALDEFGRRYPDLVEAFPTRSVPLTGRLRPLRVAAENTWLARQARDDDVVHHMGGVLPPAHRGRSVVTVHDLQPFDMPENFAPSKRLYLQQAIPWSVRRADVVVAPSQFVRQGIVDRFGVDPARVMLAPWGVEPPSTDVSVAEVQARYRLPRRWFVYPSFTWWHKGHGLLVRAFAQLAAREDDLVLVLTGGRGPADQAVDDAIAELGLTHRVRRTGLVPRRDVLAIMRGAVALTFPSRYEGFGLPVLEAMSLGTPVLAADSAALPEIVGSGGRIVPGGDADAWVAAMSEMLADEAARERLVAAGRERVAKFTWAATAADTVAAYRAAARAAGPGAGDDTGAPT
ncbi:MAG TPA: glycosyltransferase family 1 protein [Acidimicrobiales bacterium]|nr:glycosyltransferase family 1 protein [Acidimicrobiales bacterium]